MVYVSNKYLDLKPVVETAAHSLDMKTAVITNNADPMNYIYTARWVLLFRRESASPLSESSEDVSRWTRRNFVVRPWTDDYNSVFKLLR